jgi:hypothetical protein
MPIQVTRRRALQILLVEQEENEKIKWNWYACSASTSNLQNTTTFKAESDKEEFNEGKIWPVMQ